MLNGVTLCVKVQCCSQGLVQPTSLAAIAGCTTQNSLLTVHTVQLLVTTFVSAEQICSGHMTIPGIAKGKGGAWLDAHIRLY